MLVTICVANNLVYKQGLLGEKKVVCQTCNSQKFQIFKEAFRKCSCTLLSCPPTPQMNVRVCMSEHAVTWQDDGRFACISSYPILSLSLSAVHKRTLLLPFSLGCRLKFLVSPRFVLMLVALRPRVLFIYSFRHPTFTEPTWSVTGVLVDLLRTFLMVFHSIALCNFWFAASLI